MGKVGEIPFPSKCTELFLPWTVAASQPGQQLFSLWLACPIENSPALLCFFCPMGSRSRLDNLTLTEMNLGVKLSLGSWQWPCRQGWVCGFATCFASLPGEECNVFAFLGLRLQPHSCSGSQHGGRRAVRAPWLHAFSSTSKVYLVCSLCHSWPHLVACRHAGGGVWLCLQMAFRVQTSCLWKGWS